MWERSIIAEIAFKLQSRLSKDCLDFKIPFGTVSLQFNIQQNKLHEKSLFPIDNPKGKDFNS